MAQVQAQGLFLGNKKIVTHYITISYDLLLESQISIQEKGKVSRVTKQEAFIKSLIVGALKGERAASQILVRLMTGLLSEQGEVVSQEIQEEDVKILERYLTKEKGDE